MTIRLTLGQKMLERGVSLTALAGRVGITMSNLSVLKNGKAKAVRFSTLSALCRELDCQPGALLQFTPETPRRRVRRAQRQSSRKGLS
jgi:putative transcriptional regulator